MPYDNEYASKLTHVEILRSPLVTEFLDQCEYLTVPSDEQGQRVAGHFSEPRLTGEFSVPKRVVAFDGSPYESSLDERLPSTKIGYVKIGAVLIRTDEFDGLRDSHGFVDPVKVARLQRDAQSYIFCLPSANVRLRGFNSVSDSFRAWLDRYFANANTRLVESDPSTSLRTTLFHLAAFRLGTLSTNDPSKLRLHRCPSCQAQGPIEIEDSDEPQSCPHCHQRVYATDCLRLWEEVSEYQSNRLVLTRLMNIVEHVLPIHYIRALKSRSLAALQEVGFVIDGPLALFGTAAWLHAAIMGYLHSVNAELAGRNLGPIFLVGLQKSGQVVDHVSLIEKYIPENRLYCIEDDYRYQWILGNRDHSQNGFGSETYYGQDFIYKTPTGRTFVLALPFPFGRKEDTDLGFAQAKVEIARYANLGRALAFVRYFESDLYKNAIIPVALAHRHTAISLVPGGRVLDTLTRESLAAANG